MTEETKRKIQTVFHSSAFYLPAITLLFSMIFGFFKNRVQILPYPATASLAFLVSLILPTMAFLKLMLPIRFSMKGEDASPIRQIIILPCTFFVLSVLLIFDLLFTHFCIDASLIPFFDASRYIGGWEIVLLAVIPALCYTFYFFGIFTSRYLEFGNTAEVIGPALFFAFFLGNIYLAIPYFLIGLVLSITRHYSDTAWSSSISLTFAYVLFLLIKKTNWIETKINYPLLLIAFLTVIAVFCAFTICASYKKRLPSYTAFEGADASKAIKILSVISPFLIIMILISLR